MKKKQQIQMFYSSWLKEGRLLSMLMSSGDFTSNPPFDKLQVHLLAFSTVLTWPSSVDVCSVVMEMDLLTRELGSCFDFTQTSRLLMLAQKLSFVDVGDTKL